MDIEQFEYEVKHAYPAGEWNIEENTTENKSFLFFSASWEFEPQEKMKISWHRENEFLPWTMEFGGQLSRGKDLRETREKMKFHFEKLNRLGNLLNQSPMLPVNFYKSEANKIIKAWDDRNFESPSL